MATLTTEKKSRFHGKTIEELKQIRDEILDRRKPSPLQLQGGAKRLEKTPERTKKRRTSEEEALDDALRTLMEKRRGAMEWNEEDEFEEQDWGFEGSGLREDTVEKLIDGLYISLGSIRAGNTSSKLWKEVVLLLSMLAKRGIINELQRHKIFKDYHIQ